MSDDVYGISQYDKFRREIQVALKQQQMPDLLNVNTDKNIYKRQKKICIFCFIQMTSKNANILCNCIFFLSSFSHYRY